MTEKTTRPSLSIAMCTYNGERFLGEQLASIQAQTRQPDELVVCDDSSTDSTVAILRAFASSAGFPVRVFVNKQKLGVRKNFEQAISLCTGDVISLCDQDDIWHPNKLARSEEVLLGPGDVGLVFGDAEVVSQSLTPLRYRLSSPAGLDRSAKRRIAKGRAVDVLARANIATGATMVFRARYRDLVLPIPSDGGRIHDGWIALLISAVAGVVYLDEPLMLYRLHEEQQVGLRAAGHHHATIWGRRWVPRLSPEEEKQGSRASVASLLAAVDVLERWTAASGERSPGIAQLLVQAAYMIRYDDPAESRRLRTRALKLDRSAKPLGRWKYNLGQSLLGAEAASRLVDAKRQLRGLQSWFGSK